MRYLLSGSLLIVLSSFCFAQKRIVQGQVQTSKGSPIPYVNTMIKRGDGTVAAFKATDHDGKFSIIIADSIELSNAFLEIRHLGFKPVGISLKVFKSHYALVLEEQLVDLSEVEVKSRPRVERRRDTLSYEVNSFAKNEDRSIGDVIRRLPGMEVSESGEIKYNGKSISHFYIDGDDLLGDRYAIGSKTIPLGMVKGVEVMQNHQPVKVLQNRVLSNQVALNLVIRDEAKLKMSGQAKIGAGLPYQYDEELNAILFNKKYKMLNVLKGNNIGEDLSLDFVGFNQSSFLLERGVSQPEALLTSGTVATPNLPKKRYYLNNSASANTNNLINLKNGLQLKSNVNFWADKHQLEYNSLNEVYLDADTIRYQEQQSIQSTPFLVDMRLSATSNKKLSYFKDDLRIAYSGNLSSTRLVDNAHHQYQQLRERKYDFSNDLQFIPQLKNKRLLQVEWFLSYFKRPQMLSIAPGVNATVLNQGIDYEATYQEGQIPSWFSRMLVSYGLADKNIKQHYRLGMWNEWQNVQTALRLIQADDTETVFEGSRDNALHWNRNRWTADATYEYVKDGWELSLRLPFAWQHIRYDDTSFRLDTTHTRWLFNPFWDIKKMLHAEDYVALNYAFTNQLGEVNNVYRGAVLVNYRSLQMNNAPLREQRNHRLGLSYHFQRSVSMFFANAGVSWNRSTANAIVSARLTNDISETVLIPLKNNVSSLILNGGLSKYLFALGATASLKTSWSSTRFNQLLNGALLPFANNTLTINPSIEVRLWNRISLAYRGTGSWIKSKIAEPSIASIQLPEQRLQQFDQLGTLSATFYRNLHITFSGRDLITAQGGMQTVHYFFVDAQVRFRFGRSKSDLELNLSNLANVKDFDSYSLSANSFWYSHYRLRGRMAVLKYSFNF